MTLAMLDVLEGELVAFLPLAAFCLGVWLAGAARNGAMTLPVATDPQATAYDRS